MSGGLHRTSVSRARVLWLIGQGIAGRLGRGRLRTGPADAGGRGATCLHARVTATMSSLSSASNAILVCASVGPGHRKERGYEQRRGRDGECLQDRFHDALLSLSADRLERIFQGGSALGFATAHVGGRSKPTIAASRIAAMPCIAGAAFYCRHARKLSMAGAAPGDTIMSGSRQRVWQQPTHPARPRRSVRPVPRLTAASR